MHSGSTVNRKAHGKDPLLFHSGSSFLCLHTYAQLANRRRMLNTLAAMFFLSCAVADLTGR
jgi:hypothetical protein